MPTTTLDFKVTPHALSRKDAAAFVGVAPTTFDKLVKSGEMPQPHRFTGCARVVWLVDDLRAAFAKMPVSAEPAALDDDASAGWDGVRV
jgi:predicted DNA-binding transcriptional regulator AlpA